MKRKLTIPEQERDTVPVVQVTLTEESAYITRYGPTGKPVSTYPAALRDVANAFKGLAAAGSGWLPEHVLWWQSDAAHTQVGLWLPPSSRKLVWRAGTRMHTLRVPMPGLVFVGRGMEYRVYALAEKTRPTPRTPLFVAPLPNVYPAGNVCMGNVPFPRCATDTITQAAALFFDSEFNHDLSGGKVQGNSNLFKFLSGLRGKRSFPKAALVPLRNTVADLMEVQNV